jgi:hypothetical protein
MLATIVVFGSVGASVFVEEDIACRYRIKKYRDV